jgi:flagellar biosynthesis protein FlhB
MAGNEQEQDRSEPATPYKLQEARKRGQVAKSMEFVSWFTLTAAVIFGSMMLDDVVRGELSLSRALFDQAGAISLSVRSAQMLLAAITWYLLGVFGLFIALVLGVAVLASFAQTGPVLSFHPVKPDFTRLNPVAGFKRVFNARMLYEAAKTFIKVMLLAALIYVCLSKAMPAMMALQMMDIHAHPAWIIKQAMQLALTVLALLACIAIVDLGFVKWDFAKRMRMSRREVKEEVKRRDGDPKVKAKIRELQREAARRGASLKRVPEADVLITNPTHLSVAVKYERGQAPAPRVIAKGAGDMALSMRESARQHGVPIIECRSVAQLLFRKTPIDAFVPPETYPAVARLLKWARRQRMESARA